MYFVCFYVCRCLFPRIDYLDYRYLVLSSADFSAHVCELFLYAIPFFYVLLHCLPFCLRAPLAGFLSPFWCLVFWCLLFLGYIVCSAFRMVFIWPQASVAVVACVMSAGSFLCIIHRSIFCGSSRSFGRSYSMCIPVSGGLRFCSVSLV